LTGGNLKMLAKGLRALMREKDREPEDVALDVRHSLIQAANVLVCHVAIPLSSILKYLFMHLSQNST
jgi:hypothetical protein